MNGRSTLATVTLLLVGCTSPSQTKSHEKAEVIETPAPIEAPDPPVPDADGSYTGEMRLDGRELRSETVLAHDEPPLRARHTEAKHGLEPVAARLPARRIEVSTMREFLAALGPDRTIVMAEGLYMWRDASILADPPEPGAESYEGLSPHLHDGVIHDVDNLAIVGLGGGARILQHDGYDHVLNFNNVTGLTLYNLILGHHTWQGYCAGGVVLIVGGRDVVLDGLDMFGSGTEGLSIADIADLELRDSIVWGCTQALATVARASDVRFTRVGFRRNGPELLGGVLLDSAQLALEDVVIAHNVVSYPSPDLFEVVSGHSVPSGVRKKLHSKLALPVPENSEVIVRGGQIVGNQGFGEFHPCDTLVRFEGTMFTDNNFEAPSLDPDACPEGRAD